eukprot:2606128-Pleurochrysis_carterae.AAC.1
MAPSPALSASCAAARSASATWPASATVSAAPARKSAARLVVAGWSSPISTPSARSDARRRH